MAAAMASLSVVTAAPVVNYSQSMRSVSHFNGGVRLNMAAPRVSRSARTFAVRAADEPGDIIDSLKKTFTGAEKDAEKKADKAASQAKSGSGDLQAKAEELKEDAQAKIEEAGDSLKAGVEDAKSSVQDALDSGKQ